MIAKSERGNLMELFSIIVGVFSVLGAIATIISTYFLRQLTIMQKGKNNYTSQSNRGKNNININH